MALYLILLARNIRKQCIISKKPIVIFLCYVIGQGVEKFGLVPTRLFHCII